MSKLIDLHYRSKNRSGYILALVNGHVSSKIQNHILDSYGKRLFYQFFLSGTNGSIINGVLLICNVPGRLNV